MTGWPGGTCRSNGDGKRVCHEERPGVEVPKGSDAVGRDSPVGKGRACFVFNKEGASLGPRRQKLGRRRGFFFNL